MTTDHEQKKHEKVIAEGGLIQYTKNHYPTIDHFVGSLNWQQQKVICPNEADCYLGDFPTLAELDRIYFKGAASKWLIPQIQNISEFSGVKDKITEGQLEEIAYMIPLKYYYLKCSELMLFFFRLKYGDYGNFYGSVDPVRIMELLGKFFIKERITFLEKANERYKEMRKKVEVNISYDTYCKNHGIENRHQKVSLPNTNEALKKKEFPPEVIQKIAEGLVVNSDNLDETHLSLMRAKFKEKYLVTPENYLLNIKTNQYNV